MAKNWAIAIGINHYQFLQPLRYAIRDAELMRDFLSQEARFEQIYFFSDASPDINGESTRPYRANLLRVLRQMFETPFMQAGDNFWFFFSGHGMRYRERDYLMPADGDPENIKDTAISISYVTERLRRCGADNVILLLDACRNEGFDEGVKGTKSGEGVGRQTSATARQTGIISIFSCSPKEYSFEIEALQQGAFTCALLEGLGVQGQCATVERLNQYLINRVLELNRQYGKRQQTPYIIAEPVTKSHLILMPQHATVSDIATLKTDALRAQLAQDFDLAKQLWIRVLAAASGQDMEAIEALGKIEAKLEEIRRQKELAVLKQQHLATLYRQGKRYINAGQRFEALRQFEEIQCLEPGYRDTEERIARLRQEIAWLQQEDIKHELQTPPINQKRSPLIGAYWLPRLGTFVSWMMWSVWLGAAWYILKNSGRSDLKGSEAPYLLVALGFLGGAVDGSIIGLTLHCNQTNSQFRWQWMIIPIVIGCMIGTISWGLASTQRESSNDIIFVALAIAGTVLCRAVLWFVSQKLSRA